MIQDMMKCIKITVAQLLLCTLFGVIGINGKPPSAILGGSRAGEKEFPYMVGLFLDDQYRCGGAIIDSTHILTAAHCVDYTRGNLAKRMIVISGTNNIRKGHRHRIKSIKKHAQYAMSDNMKNDIAIITLRHAITFNARRKPVKLPTEDTHRNFTATVTGWGDLSYPNGSTPAKLRKLVMNVISSNEKCILPRSVLHDSQICGYTKRGSGVCIGDSGGPLVSDGILIGIPTYIYPCAIGYPDVFTRVYSYLDWIKEETKNSDESIDRE